MSDNKLNIQITAEDLASAVIAGINQSFKKALGEIATAETALTTNLAAHAKQRESDRKTSLDNQLAAAKNAYQDEWDNLTMSKLQLEEKRYNEEKLQ